jgi:putative tricarboxylic transport membrane protein
MDSPAKAASPPRGVSERAVGISCTALFFLVGVVMMADNYRIGAGWTREGPASGYFPFRIGAIICIASVALLVQILRNKQGAGRLFVSWDRFKRVLSVLVPTVAFVVAIQLAGIYVAAAVFIAAFMRVMDRYGWMKTASISVAVSAMLFWLFEVQFMVPLPKGPLEALFGY